MSDTADTAAQKRAAARRAKILARGNDGLSRIATTARGDEASVLYDHSSASSPPPLPSEDPPDFDLAQLDPTPPRPLLDHPSHPPNNDMLSALLSQMGGAPPNMNPNIMDPNAAQQQQQQQQQPKTLFDRVFPLIRLLSLVALALYSISIWEPALKYGSSLLELNSQTINYHGWAALASRPAMWDEISPVPLLYSFLTLEILLHSLKFLFSESIYDVPTTGIIATVLQVLPPAISTPILMAQKYWALLSTLLDDFSVLVVVLCGWIFLQECISV